ncbi:MAG: beta-mannanase [Actinomycetia bacterium]|nr:beta-mannanase [Actinomycetes bacterium]MCP4961006.1 beta-mannanase [Actinomycetes bacterium]
MLPRDLGRSSMILILVLCLGAVTVSSATRSPERASAEPPATLVPRPSNTTAALETPVATPIAEAPTTEPPDSTAEIDLSPTTTSTTGPDPFAWMEEVPVPGQTFIGVTTKDGTLDEIAAFEHAAGKRTDAVMVSRDWAAATPDIETIEIITADGHLPIIAWEPWNHAMESTFDRRRGEQSEYALSTIIDGEHDDLIDDWAIELAEWGRPVAIRFAHEMNGFWYPWSESVNGNAAGQYVAAWRHVHDRFDAAGASNVIWIWSPNPIDPNLTPIDRLYPGDAYVDWIGVVGYLGNGIDPTVYVPTFDQLFGPTIDEVRELTDLPIVLTELGATELGGKKAMWLTHVLETIAERDDIIGFIWFEVDKETDWRIVSSEEARQAFSDVVAADGFGTPRAG